jgi:hypothetical protein
MKKSLFSIFSLVFLFLVMHLNAATPRTIAYQGILTDSVGTPKKDGKYAISFSFYDAESGGTAIWNQKDSLFVRQGMFSAFLGNASPFGANLKFDKPYWLGISVNGASELKPRVPITSVGYCFYALRADTAEVAKTIKGNAIYVTQQGIVTIPAQSAVSLDDISPFSVPLQIFTKVPFCTELYDRQNEFDVDSARFIPKESGDYLFCASIYTNGETCNFEIDIFINGNRENGFAHSYQDLMLQGSRVVHLNVGDYADVRIYQSSKTTWEFTPNGIWNWLTINKVN